MIRVACPQCKTKYRFDVRQLQGKSRAKARCQRCGAKIEVSAAETAAAAAAEAAPEDALKPRKDATARVRRMRSDESVDGSEQTLTGTAALSELELPQDRKYSLAVLQGTESGKIFTITKSQTSIGRAECDITLDDPECSRKHAVLEILGSRNMIADMKSTNGTFVDGKRVDRAELDNHSEFRVGDHVLMFIVTDRE